MSNVTTKVNRKMSISAVITRADGTVEDLGQIYSEGYFLDKVVRLAKKFMKGIH